MKKKCKKIWKCAGEYLPLHQKQKRKMFNNQNNQIMENKMTLNEMVRAEAIKNVSRYNFHPRKAEMLVHHNVCKSLVNLADKHNFPMGVLVYIAVGTNAHRPIVFEKGYTKCDVEKAEKIISLCEIFAKKFGENTRTNDRLVHAVCRYVDRCGGGVLKFRQLCNALDAKTFVMPKTAKELAEILCGKEAIYSNGGYIIKVNAPTRHKK